MARRELPGRFRAIAAVLLLAPVPCDCPSGAPVAGALPVTPTVVTGPIGRQRQLPGGFELPQEPGHEEHPGPYSEEEAGETGLNQTQAQRRARPSAVALADHRRRGRRGGRTRQAAPPGGQRDEAGHGSVENHQPRATKSQGASS